VLIRLSDGYVSIVSGRSLARPYIGIKRMRRRSENLVASSRRVRSGVSIKMRGVIARNEMARLGASH
jgi:hypothetical protein